MDDRILQVAAGGRPATGWNSAAFRELFPDQVRFIARYEKRVETLKSIGYLTPEGQLTPEFRLHFAIKNGMYTPELQRLRLESQTKCPRGAPPTGAPAPDRPLRVERQIRIRPSPRRAAWAFWDDIRRIQREAEHGGRPRNASEKSGSKLFGARSSSPRRDCRGQDRPAGLHGFSSRTNSARLPIGPWRAVLPVRRDEKDRRQAPANRRARSFYAKEKRLAQLAMGLRPIFWAVKVAMPREARRLEKAVERCSRLAFSQEARRITREEVGRAYADWRKAFIERPTAEIQVRAATGPAAGSPGIDPKSGPTPPDGLSGARAMYEKGYAALQALGRPDVALLRKWVGRKEDLLRAIFR